MFVPRTGIVSLKEFKIHQFNVTAAISLNIVSRAAATYHIRV